MMDSIDVLEQGTLLSYRLEEMRNYSGPGYPGGVAHAFQVMRRAFPLLDDGRPLERREITLVTAFPGFGARDAFELVTRCVTDGRYLADKYLPEAANALESPCGRYYFRFSYRGTGVAVTIRPRHIRDEYMQLAKKENRTPEEEQALLTMKKEMAERLLNSRAEDVYDASIF